MEVLNIYGAKEKELIKKAYEKRKETVKANALRDVQTLVDGIRYYKGLSFEEIYKGIVKDASEIFGNIDDETAFKRGLYENLMNGYSNNPEYANLSEKQIHNKAINEMNNVMGNLLQEDKDRIISNYKKRNKEEYVEKKSAANFSNHEIFNSMSMEEIKEYIQCFYQARYRDNLYRAQRTAIYDVADELHKEVPVSLRDKRDQKAVTREVKHIIAINEIKQENKSLKDRIVLKTREALKAFRRNSYGYVGLIALGTIGGIDAAMIAARSGNEKILPAIAITAPAIAAALTISYSVISWQDDKEAIEEADKMGLLTKLVDAQTAKRDLIKYDQEMRDKYNRLIIEENKKGGKNGLH